MKIKIFNREICVCALLDANSLCAKSNAEMEINMKKKILFRGLLGFPLGVAICYFITIITSLIFADGFYSPCVPSLTAVMGNEIRAVVLQAVLGGVLGAGFAAGSVIWDIEHWGIVKQTGIYFILACFLMMPIAYFTHWMEHSVKGFFSYLGIFVLIFIMIWAVEFLVGKQNVKRMNAKLDQEKNDRLVP